MDLWLTIARAAVARQIIKSPVTTDSGQSKCFVLLFLTEL